MDGVSGASLDHAHVEDSWLHGTKRECVKAQSDIPMVSIHTVYQKRYKVYYQQMHREAVMPALENRSCT